MTIAMMERVSSAVAAEVRAEMGRQAVSQTELAARLGKNGRWLSVRLSKTATVDMTIDEIAEIAEALGVDAEGFVLAALRACRDSNPKPSDLEFSSGAVRRSLTVNRRNRSAWELAA